MINAKSLREQVYDYLRHELQTGELVPGSSLNLNDISQSLGISKTPLRDALIQLESEGFVNILPRRGVVVTRLTLDDIRNGYEIVGALESSIIYNHFDEIGPHHIAKMKQLNVELIADLDREDFQTYYERNLMFHDTFLSLSENEALKRLIMPIKRRLYDFPKRGYILEWECRNCEEHRRFIECIEKGDRDGAAKIWRDEHWSFDVQRAFILRFYFSDQVPGAENTRAFALSR